MVYRLVRHVQLPKFFTRSFVVLWSVISRRMVIFRQLLVTKLESIPADKEFSFLKLLLLVRIVDAEFIIKFSFLCRRGLMAGKCNLRENETRQIYIFVAFVGVSV
mgnify:CR=1 FL=1